MRPRRNDVFACRTRAIGDQWPAYMASKVGLLGLMRHIAVDVNGGVMMM
jgi:hypothetical protein